MWVREATNAELLMRSALRKPAQSLHRRMTVDPEQPGDPGDRDASLAKLKSLRRHGLINRGLLKQVWVGNGRSSRPPQPKSPRVCGLHCAT